MSNKKTFIFDLSVLLSAGKRALHAFEGHDIVIPLAVIKELEYKQKDSLEGYTARSILKELERLRSKNQGSLTNGVSRDTKGGTIRVEINHSSNREGIPESMRAGKTVEDRVLIVARNLHAEDKTCTLVSNNLTVRLAAEGSFHMEAIEYLNPSFQGHYTGVLPIDVSSSIIDRIYNDEVLSYEEIGYQAEDYGKHMGIILSSHRSNALVTAENGKVRNLRPKTAFEISGKNKEQKFALNYLMDPDIPIISLGGPAGTGKTLLALAAGVDQVVEQRKYKKIVIFRPVTAVGSQELGFLPGTEEEKMQPWAGAIYDALESMAPPRKGGGGLDLRAELEGHRQIDILPVTHIRGRNLRDSFIIIDEAQNLDRNTLLSLLARVADNSKVVFSWDAAQKDNPNLGRHDGIVALVDTLRHQEEFAHVTLTKSERSRVAEMASAILEDE